MDPRVERAIAGLEREHHGAVCRQHVAGLGIDPAALDRAVGSGRLVKTDRGIYRRPGTLETFRYRVESARLRVGEGAVAARRTAGALFDLLPAREVEIMTTASRTRKPTGFRVLRTNFLPDQSVVVVDGIPTTNVPRTLLDLGGVLAPGGLRRAVKAAVAEGLTDLGPLYDELRLTARMGRPGVAAFRDAVTELGALEDPKTESDLEDVMLELLDSEGFRRPECQRAVRDRALDAGRPDAIYRDLRIALEADGYEWHSARPEWLRDRRKQNALAAAGYVILRFTWDDVRRPAHFVKCLERTWERRARDLGRPDLLPAR